MCVFIHTRLAFVNLSRNYLWFYPKILLTRYTGAVQSIYKKNDFYSLSQVHYVFIRLL